MLGKITPPNLKTNESSFAKSEVTPPASVDWRGNKILTPIKDQGWCGSCWAFSASQILESAIAIKTNTTAVRLSEQEYVSCAGADGYGCNGGFEEDAWNYAIKMKG